MKIDRNSKIIVAKYQYTLMRNRLTRAQNIIFLALAFDSSPPLAEMSLNKPQEKIRRVAEIAAGKRSSTHSANDSMKKPTL
ncbi:MAG: hypothetical protein WBL19_01230 [Minisyncoccia bacterium]